MTINYVFVYGTLRRSEHNHHFMNGATLVAEQAWTEGILFDTGLGYPAVKKARDGKVYGELYLVSDEQLHTLDRLEGYDEENPHRLYDRDKQIIYYDTGKTEAYIYTFASHNEKLLSDKIPLGDWKEPRIHKQDTVLYFAYGSCMDDARFKLANVHSFFQKMVGRGILEGYTLRYTKIIHDGGRADIVEEGGTVEGKVYEIPIDCIDYLYKREGVGTGMYRPAFVDLTINGKLEKDVLTFIVVDKQPETAPPQHYSEEIIRGGTGVLSESYIEGLKDHIIMLCKQKENS
ncbi:gamma-glutamylcyclotransferase [Neobacillus sp. K501]